MPPAIARFAAALTMLAIAPVALAVTHGAAHAQDVPTRFPRATTGAASADDKAFLADFVQNGYLQAWFAYPEAIRLHFADPVESYWGRRNVPRAAVEQDKVAYAKKWTFRFYRLKTETLAVEPIAERPGVWRVSFAFDFIADRLPPRSAGVGEATLVVQVAGDRITILGETGRVVRRE